MSIIRIALLGLTYFLGISATFANAPVPKAAQGVEIPQEKGYFAEEIRNGLYWVIE